MKIEGIAYNKTKIVKEKNDIMVTSVKACLDVSSPKKWLKKRRINMGLTINKNHR